MPTPISDAVMGDPPPTGLRRYDGWCGPSHPGLRRMVGDVPLLSEAALRWCTPPRILVQVLELVVLPLCLEHALPLCLRMGTRRAVNPQLGLAGAAPWSQWRPGGGVSGHHGLLRWHWKARGCSPRSGKEPVASDHRRKRRFFSHTPPKFATCAAFWPCRRRRRRRAAARAARPLRRPPKGQVHGDGPLAERPARGARARPLLIVVSPLLSPACRRVSTCPPADVPLSSPSHGGVTPPLPLGRCGRWACSRPSSATCTCGAAGGTATTRRSCATSPASASSCSARTSPSRRAAAP